MIEIIKAHKDQARPFPWPPTSQIPFYIFKNVKNWTENKAWEYFQVLYKRARLNIDFISLYSDTDSSIQLFNMQVDLKDSYIKYKVADELVCAKCCYFVYKVTLIVSCVVAIAAAPPSTTYKDNNDHVRSPFPFHE